MDHFHYINEHLHCESVPVHELAEAIGTPAFVYSRRTFVDHLDRLRHAFAALSPRICFSLKSCANLSIARLLIEHGAGMDLVSGGELHRALKAGVDPSECVFAGVGKTDDELRAGLTAGVGWMNVESEAELERLRTIAASLGVRANAALRINPDIDAHTHRHTTTGVRETKFGVDFERAAHLFMQNADDPHVDLAGLHVHIGSP
ncbi:MAG: hypothetical protein KC983_03210, partial [Phycisphaerales bacterium]|nr:hypothetical protein [Phycisphaerales bacterium]